MRCYAINGKPAIAKRSNECHVTIHWQFTARDARVKLQPLYPTVAPSSCDTTPGGAGTGSV